MTYHVARSSLLSPPRPRSAPGSVADLLATGGVRAVFQPIVDLRTRAAVGYEALARGPEDSPLESPGALFAAAEREGLVSELDWACRAAALRDALAAGLHHSRGLFLNVEPRTISESPPAALAELIERAGRELTLVAEVTERAVIEAPAALVSRVGVLHRQGVVTALDDVGVDPRSLALLPFVAPDVVKLDMSIVQRRDLRATVAVAAAVHAHAERAGAHVVAEGIETEEHLATALALGADLGQGWLFGRPGPLPREATLPAPLRLTAALRLPDTSGATPFELLSEHEAPRRGNKELLLRMSLAMESQVAAEGESSVIVSTFQAAAFLTPAARRRYRRLAERSALVGVLGTDVPSEPEPGVRGGTLAPDAPLRGEWDMCAVGPFLAGAFAAHDLGDTGPDAERRFDFVLTRDRDLVVAATRELLVHIAPRD